MGHGNSDKLYITHQEWSGEFGAHGAAGGIMSKKPKANFRRLPFYCCALSLQPFEHPVCSPNGTVFDLLNIIPYLKKYGTNPVTGQKLQADQLVKLNFFKNEHDEYHCPVTFKTFNDHTHIVAIKPSGNVFAYEAIERLNIKAKLWRDLVTDDPFTRKDIITIQDPHNLEDQNLSSFHYLQNDLKVVDEEEERAKANPLNSINSVATRKLVARSTNTATPKKPATMAEAKPYNQANFSKGISAASFTSTSLTPVTENESALIDEETYMFSQIKDKGVARIETNWGDLTIDLHCDKCPKTCFNFIMLAKKGYYKGVSFHRNIKGFMIQGGDPTGTGRGGESYWGKDFEDEIHNGLGHDSRGALSMANKGAGTNSSQFFLTYGPAKHLDGKHTVFGNITAGMDVLDILERIPNTVDPATGKVDTKPAKAITMNDVFVITDPFEKYQTRLERRREREANPEKFAKKLTDDDRTTWLGGAVSSPNSGSKEPSRIGKYLKRQNDAVETNLLKAKRPKSDVLGLGYGSGNEDDMPPLEPPVKKSLGSSQETTNKKSKGYSFGSFSNW